MPNLDGGHYFLTAILPIDNRGIVEHEGFKSSPIHMVREALETLPTALQSPATVKIDIQSPFARTTRTHLTRFFVVDDPYYNGRDPEDAILSAIKGTNLLEPQPVDSLACPYLIWAADFDPLNDGLRGYLQALWSAASAELTTVFQYCYGFDTVKDPASFADFVIACQVETTMPFNDYWIVPPPFPSLPTWQLVLAPIIAIGLGIWAWVGLGLPWWGGLLTLIVLLGLSLWADYGLVMSRGAKPFPTAPNSTLKHILKALYLQQAFTRFVIANQGAEPAALKAAFDAFVQQNRPSDLDGPTQPAGVIRSQLSETPRA